jgi:hypothetical protein
VSKLGETIALTPLWRKAMAGLLTLPVSSPLIEGGNLAEVMKVFRDHNRSGRSLFENRHDSVILSEFSPGSARSCVARSWVCARGVFGPEYRADRVWQRRLSHKQERRFGGCRELAKDCWLWMAIGIKKPAVKPV